MTDTTDHARYAVYYAPPAGSALARFGAAWLGWDAAAGAEVPHPVARLAGIDVADLTAAPRRYGFHATLKPPFRLAPGTDPAALDAAIAALARAHAPFEVAIRLARLGRFLALVPAGDAPRLDALAAGAVQDLDRFRAPPDAAELARRRAGGLTPEEDTNLVRWGYPHVLDRFRFHLTLTGPLEPATMAAVEAALAALTAEHTARPLPVADICLFGQRPDGRFRILARHALTG